MSASIQIKSNLRNSYVLIHEDKLKARICQIQMNYSQETTNNIPGSEVIKLFSSSAATKIHPAHTC